MEWYFESGYSKKGMGQEKTDKNDHYIIIMTLQNHTNKYV